MAQGEIEPAAEPFWAGLEAGHLLLQRCERCGHHQYPPAPLCSSCASVEFGWVEASGRGRVLSWITTHHVFNSAWASRVPYTTVLVELAEQPDLAMYGTIASAKGLHDGIAVEARVDTSGDEPVVEWTLEAPAR